MPAFQLIVTTAGLDALVDAQNAVTDPIVITEVGLASANFAAAPTLVALPHEFKRIGAVGGTSASETVIHMVATDASADTYTAYGFGLFLSDGTLFAVYAQADPILIKASIAQSLFVCDIAFLNAVAAAIEFGNANFLNPPATETTQGVARLATNALADAGVDHTTIMTPAKVKRVLDAWAATINAAWAAFQGTVNAALAALAGRTITGSGLVTGGGDLSANRVLDVAKASSAEIVTGTEDGKAITPLALASLPKDRSANGYERLPGGLIVQWGQVTANANGATSVTFPIAFPNACLFGDCAGANNTADTGVQDNFAQPRDWTTSGMTLWSSMEAAVATRWFALGY